jgi:hypothetical protein
MTVVLVVYFVFGFCFGLVTYSSRHLFSEGPSRRAPAAAGKALGGRLLWALICSALWPIMGLTGLLSWWRLSRRR